MSPTPREPVDAISADIKCRIINMLWQRGVSCLKNLDMEVTNGTVKLRGTAPSFYERQLCLTCVQHIPGVFQIVDDIKVEWPAELTSTSATTA